MKDWKLLKVETLYSGYRNMIKKTYEDPDGNIQVFDIYGSEERTQGVSTIAITQNQEIILTRQHAKALDHYHHELPGGFVEPSESVVDAGVRELREETGFEGALTDFSYVHYSNAYMANEEHYIMILNCEKNTQIKLDKGEFVETAIVPLEDIWRYIETGKMMGVPGLLMALKYIEENNLL